MIKCKVHGEKKIFQVKASGTPKELTNEAMFILTELYGGIKKVDEASAEKFRTTLFASLIDPNSPVLKQTE